MFSEIFEKQNIKYITEKIYSSTESDVIESISTQSHNPESMIPLFSPAGENLLEEMAKRSSEITRLRFGNVIQLYTPLYISNECTSSCTYCGFNADNDITRATLSLEQVLQEADIIYKYGFRHILLLTGEHRKAVPVEYLSQIAEKIHEKFSSVSIEVYPMEADEYSKMVSSGIDGLTLYQETYDKVRYNEVHPYGKKRDFTWRLNGPDRGGKAGLRKIGIGSLLGLSDWRIDGFFTALHGLYLTQKYWKSQISLSFPRLRESTGDFTPELEVSDRHLTQLICAMRIILHDAGIVLSTRESSYIRDNLFPLGVTMMSAGSVTEPGGHSNMGMADNQFAIEDDRTAEEISSMLKSKGFEAVWKDWDRDLT